MRTSQRLSSVIVAAVLATSASAFIPALAQTPPAPAAAVDAAPRGNPMTIMQIYNQLEAGGYRNITKIESERGRFEVDATNRDGQRVELYLDGTTGQVIRSEAKGRSK